MNKAQKDHKKYKNGDNSHKPIWNNKFKVINKEIYATDYPSYDEEEEEEDSLPDNRIERVSRQHDVSDSKPLSLCINENEYDDYEDNKENDNDHGIIEDKNNQDSLIPSVGDFVEIYWKGERK